MKDIKFIGPKILAAILLIAMLSLIGMGNPKTLPFYTLFFIGVFVLIFFLNKMAKESARSEKSGSKLGPVLQVIGLVIFVAAISALGFVNGIVGYIAWFVAISLIVAGVFLWIKNRQRHFELVQRSPLIKYVFGALMAILAVVLPVIIVLNGDLFPNAAGKGVMPVIFALLSVLLFIGLMAAAILLINKWGQRSANRALGYLAIVIGALLPGLLGIVFKANITAYAGVYMAALVTLILLYFAMDLGVKME